MKSYHYLSLALMALPLLATARPASPNPVSHTNPDGTVTTIRIYGDENFSFVTDADNNKIIEQDNSGFWRPAIRNGKELLFNDSSLELLRAEQPKAESSFAQGPARMASIDNNGQSLFPTIGEHHFPVILIEFSDTHFTVPQPQQAVSNLCNQENYSQYGGRGSIRDFYMSNSNNKFQPTFDVYGPVRVSKSASYYVARGTSYPGAGKYGRWGEALEEAVKAIDAQGVDFSQYDHDGDGDIDFIYFIYAGYGQADSGNSNTIWPHQGEYASSVHYLGVDELYPDGKRFGPYACSNELRGQIPYGQQQPYLDGIGAFSHEFGHVLGLPDLYDAMAQSGSSSVYTKTPGVWTTMDQGSYNLNSTCPPQFSAYEQWLCKWIDYTDLTLQNEGIHCTIKPLAGEDRNAFRLRIQRANSNPSNPTFFNEYFVLENRGDSKWDAGLPERGMLVWRINYNRNTWYQNRVNTGGVSNVEIIAADGNDSYCYPTADYTAIYDGAPGQLSPVNKSSLWRYFITSIEADESGDIQFDYNIITEAPNLTTVLHDNPRKAPNGKRMVQLKWDEVPEADGYCLTVKRKDSAGREYVVDGLNEKFIGNTTEYEIRNLSSAAFNQTMTAYVRVVKLVPSAQTSNVITFVPNDLEAGYESGVEQLTTGDFQVRGLKGAIEAPENAEIFNISGMAAGRENLPAGIYIVRYGSKTQKVVVR